MLLLSFNFSFSFCNSSIFKRNFKCQLTPIIKSYGGVPIVRGGKYQRLEGDNFPRTVIWEFPSYDKALECHESKEYQEGWELAKNTTERNLQIIEGFEN